MTLDPEPSSPCAVQVNESTNVAGSPGELLSRRCVSLMKSALRPDMWPRAELKLQWFDKLLMTVVRWHILNNNFFNVFSIFGGAILCGSEMFIYLVQMFVINSFFFLPSTLNKI